MIGGIPGEHAAAAAAPVEASRLQAVGAGGQAGGQAGKWLGGQAGGQAGITFLQLLLQSDGCTAAV